MTAPGTLPVTAPGRGSDRPLVSVCVAAHNAEPVLGAALRSLLAQTYPRLEVVLIDDGSTDRTWEVARSVFGGATDRPVQCLRNERNRGGFQTMNQAVALAKGDLIAVYHADDVYEPTIVEHEVAYLETHPEAGAVFCLDHYIDDDGRVFGGTTLPREFRGRDRVTYQEVVPFLLKRKNILFRCPTFMVRRAVWEAVGPFHPETYGIAADLEMWLRILRRCPVGILDERLMRYRFGKKRWSWSNTYNHLRTEPECFFKVMDDYLDLDGWHGRLSPRDLTEYDFHRCDDETYRAANLLIRGDAAAAWNLLHRPFPVRTLLRPRRRKWRVLLLRTALRVGLAARLVRPLTRLVLWSEGGPRH